MNSSAGFAVELLFSPIYSSHGIFVQNLSGRGWECWLRGMVRLVGYYVVPCVKGVELGSGTRDLRMVAVFSAGIQQSLKID